MSAGEDTQRALDVRAALLRDSRALATDVAVNLHGIAARGRLEVEPPGFVVEHVDVSGRDDDGSTTVVMVRPATGDRFQVRIVANVEHLPGVAEERRQIEAWRDEQLERARKAREHPVIRYNGQDVTSKFRCRWVPRGGPWPADSWSGTVHGDDWRGGWVCDALERVHIDRVNGRLTYVPASGFRISPDDDRPGVITFEPRRERRADDFYGWPHRLTVPVPAVKSPPWSGYALPDVDAVGDPPDPDPNDADQTTD